MKPLTLEEKIKLLSPEQREIVEAYVDFLLQGHFRGQKTNELNLEHEVNTIKSDLGGDKKVSE